MDNEQDYNQILGTLLVGRDMNNDASRRFAFRNDAQKIFEIALDLDDSGIHCFTRSDLEQVWGAAVS